MKTSTYLAVLLLIALINIVVISLHLHLNNDNEFNKKAMIASLLPPAGKREIIKLLSNSGVEITPDLIKKLPSIDDFNKLYGPEAKIIGLDTCDAFQANVHSFKSMIGPAGVYNSGTTLLYNLLKNHCVIQERVDKFDNGSFSNRPQHIKATMGQRTLDGIRTGFFNDLPWGKHAPITWREDKEYRPNRYNINEAYPDLDYNDVFPVVIVKVIVNVKCNKY